MSASLQHALLFAGGDAPPSLADIDGLQEQLADTLIVCADRGLEHCVAAGLTPHRLVGDFDSVSEAMLLSAERSGAQRMHFPRDKDASDLELALDGLCDHGVEAVTLLGVSGGRTDHLLFNWTLPVLRDWPFALRLVDATVDALRVTAEHPAQLRVPVGTTISLLPLARCDGVTTTGLRWPLTDHTLAPGSTHGLSNEALSSHCSVSVRCGTLLAMRVR